MIQTISFSALHSDTQIIAQHDDHYNVSACLASCTCSLDWVLSHILEHCFAFARTSSEETFFESPHWPKHFIIWVTSKEAGFSYSRRSMYQFSSTRTLLYRCEFLNIGFLFDQTLRAKTDIHRSHNPDHPKSIYILPLQGPRTERFLTHDAL